MQLDASFFESVYHLLAEVLSIDSFKVLQEEELLHIHNFTKTVQKVIDNFDLFTFTRAKTPKLVFF